VRSTRGKNAKGKKITGIQMSPDNEKLLVTSNDSRIRLYNMKDYSLVCKYKGLENESSQIKASFSDGGKFIICGSENDSVYIWGIQSDYVPPINPKFTGYRKDRNDSYECFQGHQSIVTVAVFAPYLSRTIFNSTEAETKISHPPTQPPAPSTSESSLNQANDLSMTPSESSLVNKITTSTHPLAVPPTNEVAEKQIIITASYSGEIRIYENKK